MVGRYYFKEEFNVAIKLNTGKVAFLIEFDNGDNQNIYFNPNDPDLATRLIASKDKIQKKN